MAILKGKIKLRMVHVCWGLWRGVAALNQVCRVCLTEEVTSTKTWRQGCWSRPCGALEEQCRQKEECRHRSRGGSLWPVWGNGRPVWLECNERWWEQDSMDYSKHFGFTLSELGSYMGITIWRMNWGILSRGATWPDLTCVLTGSLWLVSIDCGATGAEAWRPIELFWNLSEMTVAWARVFIMAVVRHTQILGMFRRWNQ